MEFITGHSFRGLLGKYPTEKEISFKKYEYWEGRDVLEGGVITHESSFAFIPGELVIIPLLWAQTTHACFGEKEKRGYASRCAKRRGAGRFEGGPFFASSKMKEFVPICRMVGD